MLKNTLKKHCGRFWLVISLMGVGGFSGCASAPHVEPDPTDDQLTLVDRCDQAAADVRANTQRMSEIQAGSSGPAVDVYAQWQGIRADWDREDNPCLLPGPQPGERRDLYQDVALQLDRNQLRAYQQGADARFEAGDVAGAREIMRQAYAHVPQTADENFDQLTSRVSRAYDRELLQRFQETKTYAQLESDEEKRTPASKDKASKGVTCIFSSAEIDPQTKQVTANFYSTFQEEREVHALCRLPAPASAYGEGNLVILLDRLGPQKEGTKNEDTKPRRVELGPLNKWGDTRFFRARFDFPQPPKPIQRGYYEVSVQIERPGQPAEEAVRGGFFWQRAP